MTVSRWLRAGAGLCLGLAWATAGAQTPAENFKKILPAIELLLLGDDIDLTIVAPADGSTTTAVSVNVSGTVIGPAGVAVQANGVSGIIAAGTYTVAKVPLAMGVNTIAVTASAPNAVPVVGRVTVNRTAQVYNIFTDHLNTPRLLTNSVGQPVWRWDNNDPFGGNVPDENPSGLGAFEFPLRDEGAYFDKETNLVYNWNRYRDLSSGRFIQADPLGLKGGDLSLYVLRENNPLSFTDPRGLETILITTYDYGIGSHSALYVATPGQLPFLYDPAGSYQPGKEPRPSGGFFEGPQANLDRYIQYQQSLGSKVDLVRLPTTPAQERAIKQQAEEIADPRGFSCSRAVSGALGGVCGIPGSGFPGILRRQAAGAQCKP